jgi:D-alanyl-D-alanine carboxypeptidase
MTDIVVEMVPAQSIDACIASAIAKQRIPGVSLAIGRSGNVAYSKGYGYSSIPYRIAPDDQTIYRLASISKQFTASR